MMDKEKCKHYDREEINIVLDGKTQPVIRCRLCGEVFHRGSIDDLLKDLDGDEK